MSWHILGAGSLGGLWAARLWRAGISVRLIMRNAARLAEYHAQAGLHFSEQGHVQVLPIPAQLSDSPEPISHLLLACKAYDALPAVQQLAPRLRPDAQIILLQNGLGSQEQVRTALPLARCIALSSTEGAYRNEQHQIVFAGTGENWLGDGKPAPNWLADLATAGIPQHWCDDIETRLWRKFAINCAINPLTVLNNCRNGELLNHTARLIALCDELTTLLTLCGHAPAAEGLATQVIKVVQGTAANVSSMLQDVRAGRRTEISYLLGYAQQQSQRLGLDLPHLTELYQQLCQTLRHNGLPDH